jgi:hypothetical protein
MRCVPHAVGALDRRQETRLIPGNSVDWRGLARQESQLRMFATPTRPESMFKSRLHLVPYLFSPTSCQIVQEGDWQHPLPIEDRGHYNFDNAVCFSSNGDIPHHFKEPSSHRCLAARLGPSSLYVGCVDCVVECRSVICVQRTYLLNLLRRVAKDKSLRRPCWGTNKKQHADCH